MVQTHNFGLADRSVQHVVEAAKVELISPYPSTSITMWPRFTDITGGTSGQEFSILCGATGTGKTTFLANLSMNLLMQKEKHFVASVSTGDTDFVKRVMSAFMEEDLNTGAKISPGKVAEFDKRFGDRFDSDNLMLSLFSNRISLSQLLSDLEIAHVRHGCKIAMLDNLNFFMEMTAEKNAIVEMDRTIHELVMFCKRIDMHVIMVMHPKKTENGRVESEFDIKGSSTAVQEAHNVFLFNRPRDERQKPVPSKCLPRTESC